MPELTLKEHCEAWYREQGVDMPSALDVWQQMYESWVEWAFSDFHGERHHEMFNLP